MSEHKVSPPPNAAAEDENTASEISIPAQDTGTGRQEERTAEEVRQGHTGDHVRYILGLSVLGVVIAFTLGYMIFF